MNATTLPTPLPSAPVPAPLAMSLDEFVRKHGGDHVELIDGVVVELPMAKPVHGRACVRAGRFLDEFVESAGIGGYVCSNDTFVVVNRNPPRVRGADVAYWSAAKVPDDLDTKGLIEAPPELCVEVVSPTNNWSEVFVKVGEYLGAGVTVVLVLDPESVTAMVFRAHNGSGQRILQRDEDLTLPDILPGFSVPVRRFFA